MAQHAGYYSPNLDKNTTTIPDSQVKYTLAGMRYSPRDKTVTIYLQAGNGKKQSSRIYADDAYTINLRDFSNAAAAVNNLVRNCKSKHKELLSRTDIQRKIITELNDDYYDMAGRPQHSGYYNPNAGYNDQFSHSSIDEDEVIDMTEIEDTLEHSRNNIYNSHTQHEGYYSPNLTERMELLFNGAELYTTNATNGRPPFVHINFKGKKGGGVVKSITLRKNLRESLNKCKQAIKDEFTYDWSTPHQNPYILSNTELEKASQALYDFALNYWGSMSHSAFQDQLASTDNKAVYYNFSSGQYDNSTKNVTLKFKSDQKFGTITVTCRSTMYPKVGSLPEMKEYVSNAFYTSAGDHQYLTNNAASKAAVYVWDAKNAHFGKANPLSRLQHSALAHADKARPYVFERIVKSNKGSNGTQLGVRFTGGGDRNWIEIFFPSMAPPNDERYYINYIRNEFSGKVGENFATRTVPGEIEKAARAVVAYYSSGNRSNKKNRYGVTGFAPVSHSYSIVPSDSVSYLEHHGILGMKWGVRRYQNEDGTLTAAGREHYGNTSRHQETTKFDRKKAIAKYGHDAYALQKQAKKALIRGDEAAAKEYNKLQIQNRDKQKELRREMADERVANYGRNVAVAGELGKSILRSYGLSLGAQIGTGIGTAIGGLAGLAVGNIPGAYAGAGLGAAISMAALSVPVASLNIQSGYVASRNISDIADSNRISGENTIRRRKS